MNQWRPSKGPWREIDLRGTSERCNNVVYTLPSTEQGGGKRVGGCMCRGHAVIVNPLSKVKNTLGINLQGHGPMGLLSCSQRPRDKRSLVKQMVASNWGVMLS